MKIFLIRHGETDFDINESLVLTEKGLDQAKKLAKRLLGLEINILYHSDLKRAIQTTEEIKKIRPSLKTVETKDLQEIYRKIIGGPSKENSGPNRFNEDSQRAEKAWKKLIEIEHKNIAVVCHGNLIRFFIAKALNADPRNFYNLEISHTSISALFLDKDSNLKILNVNDTSHLS